MFTTIIFALAVVTSGQAGRPGRYQSRCYARPNSTILDYTVTDIQNRQTTKVSDLAQGALTLVVNVATYCRLTLHYLQLNQLLEENQNLNVLAYPCDQFGHQEPGVNGTEILNGLRYVRPGNGFVPHPRIHMLSRGDVNGQKEAPLYTYLKSSCPPPTLAKFKSRESFWDPIKPSDVSWNFEKFLVSASGLPLYRFLPNVEPSRFQPIISALSEPNQEPASQTEKLKSLLNALDDSMERDQSA
ncbi:epididymal secretory glutathione peroxidase-like [Biomphalaria glabrata]|uniref:Glutathione peroxidase n=1 Tax=Biomphalaria glabrata TaxID=6526 RepID=A0A9U8E048_BIOGL|nr:epididymal secretory glutathione peroxidase-like [Biomphalaria glabrata]KAI8783015.1 Glutathione peroxidase 2 [Biomphalaria glabrata]